MPGSGEPRGAANVPAPEPVLPVFLTARWSALAMLNYEVDPAVLTPLVPPGTSLDSWRGRAVVSMVGFRFLETRVLGIPVPFHRDFDEVNLRFYVRRDAPGGPRRGVVFVKEIVPRRAIAWVARTLYGENYVRLPMRHDVVLPGHATYAWRSRAAPGRSGPRWNRLTAGTRGEPALPAPGSEEEFITEHYWGYARQRDGGTVEYRVEHPQWRVWAAPGAELDIDAAGLYGSGFAPFLAGRPASAFVAEGSEVVVRTGTRLSTAAGTASA